MPLFVLVGAFVALWTRHETCFDVLIGLASTRGEIIKESQLAIDFGKRSQGLDTGVLVYVSLTQI